MVSIEVIILLGIGVVLAGLAYQLYFSDGLVKQGGRSFFLPKKTVSELAPRERKKVKTSPVSGTCKKCSKKVTMPFRCKFCKGLFCSGHRLPENHDCEGL